MTGPRYFVYRPLVIYTDINIDKYDNTPVLYEENQIIFALWTPGSTSADNNIMWEILRRTLGNVMRGNNKNVVLSVTELDSFANRNSMNRSWSTSQGRAIVNGQPSTTVFGKVSDSYAMPDSFYEPFDTSLTE